MPGGPEYPVLGGVEHKIGAVPPIFSNALASGTEVDPSFISSTTVVHAPTLYLTNEVLISVAGTYTWICPLGVTAVFVEEFGGGAGGSTYGGNGGGGGGGGGAYARRVSVPVTPGTVYTFIVGAAGVSLTGSSGATAGGDSSFTGDSGVQVIAKGGNPSPGGSPNTHGTGGSAASSTGDTKFSGGDGGDGAASASSGGGGGGASGNRAANGNSGNSLSANSGGAGGVGSNGGGSGGRGGDYNTDSGLQPGSVPGGGGGGGGGFEPGANGADGSVHITTVFTTTTQQTARARIQNAITKAQTAKARVSSVISKSQMARARVSKSVPKAQFSTARIQKTVTKIQLATARVQTTTLSKTQTATAHISSSPTIDVPFIGSVTHVWSIFSLYDPNLTFSGPGNGGETFGTRLNSNGTTTTATLTSGIGSSGTGGLTMTGDSGMPPARVPFVVTIDSEQVLLVSQGAGAYLVRQRAMGNTTAAIHSSGATISWDDSYDMAIVSNANIGTDFTADIESTGSSLYTGFLMAFDSSQAYKADGSRFPLHVTEFMGVFVAGAGVSGLSKVDGSQPSAIHAPESASDHCGAALTVPALITTAIVPGDVIVVRYTNPAAFVLDLGPRSGAIQSWFGLKRVDTSDNDVTYTNPNGIIVDTKSGYFTYTGSVNTEPDEPIPNAIGIAPDASDLAGHAIPTPSAVPWLTVTLPGTDRYFTDSIHYSERGWPIGVLSCRQGGRRVPLWRSWDWHNFSYVYSGFGTDDSFAQVIINRNGMTGVLPTISLPGPQDIDGPNAVWDDGTYYFGASWYVVLVATPYLVVGPIIGGGGGPTFGDTPPPVGVPVVTFPGGGGSPVVTPPVIEGGSGGGITPGSTGLNVWQIF